MGAITIFSFELCPPDPTILFTGGTQYIYMIYVSEKLGLGGNDVHQTMEHNNLIVIGGRMTLKHVPMLRMRKSIKNKTGLYRQH